ncbi:cytochrome P450 89A2-like [Cucumis melo var. makuwa]|uniref:Cytochrome P450 89A2-like n=2 Tax=Cucumis melo TaxID=3656 RepID=A0A5A7VF17_CUCMM|nr:cytochrome P450 89A2-like [Cucumis melo var. makuwa]TYK00969.1 cytochrome P450 89A2-like [Cucumis melo var. makuwa]
MEIKWLSILITTTIFIITIFKLIRHARSLKNLPPGPSPLPFLGNILLLRKHSSSFFSLLHTLHLQYGPIFTLHFASRPVIFIAGHSLAHQALLHHGAAFADRPPPSTTTKILYSNHITIFTAFHGPNWNLLRRNLISEILHPSRLKLHSDARRWSLLSLVSRLKLHSQGGTAAVCFVDHFWPTMMELSVFMCFGLKIEEDRIKALADVLHRVLLYSSSQNKLNQYPLKLGKFIHPNLWKELSTLRDELETAIIPLIEARFNNRQGEIEQRKNEFESESETKSEQILPYLDTLINLHLPEEDRKLEEGEIISLCAEFLNGIVHSTVVVMEWAMANIVKYPEIQEKLWREMNQVMNITSSKELITEEDLKKLPYLKAVIMETLRRHPPGHLALPHLVTEEVVLDGKFVVPEKTTVHFAAAEMARNGKVWEEPMEFRAERFLRKEEEEEEEEILTGKKEIRFMPFGGGRRICPGIGISMLHLQYFVGNLVWLLKWDAIGEVDLEEKLEVSIVMKTPLEARITAR